LTASISSSSKNGQLEKSESAIDLANDGCGIAHDDLSIADILQHNSSHADNCTFAYAQRFPVRSLLECRTGPNVSVIADFDTAVTADSGRKRNEVANPAVMGDIRIDVALKVPADASIARQHRIGAEDRSLANRDVFEPNVRRIDNGQEAETLRRAAICKAAPHLGIGNRNSDLTIAMFVAAQLLERYDVTIMHP
jgi:hypothetical protein